MVSSGTGGERFGSLCIWQWHPPNHSFRGDKTFPIHATTCSLLSASSVKFQLVFSVMQIRGRQVLFFPPFSFLNFLVCLWPSIFQQHRTIFILGGETLVSLFPYCEQQVHGNRSCGENRLERSDLHTLWGVRVRAEPALQLGSKTTAKTLVCRNSHQLSFGILKWTGKYYLGRRSL